MSTTIKHESSRADVFEPGILPLSEALVSLMHPKPPALAGGVFTGK